MQFLFFLGLTAILGIPADGFVNRYGRFPAVANKSSVAMSRKFKLSKSFSRDDIQLTAPQLIAKRGYPVEVHRINTKDGYILEAHRIPAPGKPVVFAFHGMFQSSRDLLMNEDHKALAYKLADAGYDVWLGNARGNYYSRRHNFLSPNTRAFWNYAVDEIIYYDVPAEIDYVLAVTGQPKLNWVGFSLGSAVMLGLLSSRPEYNDKVNLFFSLGTTAHVGGVKSPVMRMLAPLASAQDVVVTALNHGEFLPQFLFPIMQGLFPYVCYPEAAMNVVGLCSAFLFIIAGFNPSQARPSTLPVMLGGTPSSVSVKMLSQWYQWINKGTFSYYDYATRDLNMRYYHQAEPPLYDLTQVRAKTVNVWAENDWLSIPKDVHSVVKRLPNVIANIRVNMDSFNHLDFIYGKDADRLVYDPILEMLAMYN